MRTGPCKGCGKNLPATSKLCPACGTKDPVMLPMNVAIPVIIVTLVLIIIFFAVI